MRISYGDCNGSNRNDAQRNEFPLIANHSTPYPTPTENTMGQENFENAMERNEIPFNQPLVVNIEFVQHTKKPVKWISKRQLFYHLICDKMSILAHCN